MLEKKREKKEERSKLYNINVKMNKSEVKKG